MTNNQDHPGDREFRFSPEKIITGVVRTALILMVSIGGWVGVKALDILTDSHDRIIRVEDSVENIKAKQSEFGSKLGGLEEIASAHQNALSDLKGELETLKDRRPTGR